MIRSSVDLPLPLGPSSAVSEPSFTRMQTSSSATKSPKRLLTLRDLDRHAHTAVLRRVRRVSRFIATSVPSASSASTTAAV